MKLTDALRREIKASSFTIEQIAAEINVQPCVLWEFMLGSIDGDTIDKLCEFLNLRLVSKWKNLNQGSNHDHHDTSHST